MLLVVSFQLGHGNISEASYLFKTAIIGLKYCTFVFTSYELSGMVQPHDDPLYIYVVHRVAGDDSLVPLQGGQ